jgi:hypothetical protein
MADRPKPIYSIHEEDPELQESINDFVLSLAERIDGLQDLHSSGDLTHLGEQCGNLADDAQRLGYPLFASIAGVAAAACLESKAEASEDALVEMTELIQRIRQAHRGAA